MKRRSPAHTVNLALQGGGAHGAFTWGVLDALLEDGRLAFDGVTGTSAGAINAAVMAHGWLEGKSKGRDPRKAARAALRRFWEGIGGQPNVFALQGAIPGLAAPPGATNPAVQWFDVVSRVWSPYQWNPLGFNPLREVLAPLIDFERLRRHAPFKLFVGATAVRTGRVRVFRDHELTLDMLLASACLPFVFQAVEVDGEPYWDGGFTGNPALFPLFYATQAADLVLVQINPLHREDVPDTAQEIIDRVNEVSFNSSLLFEMRAIAFVQRLLDENRIDRERYKRLRMHMIANEEHLRALGAASKYDTAATFLEQLFKVGRTTGLDWLDQNWAYLGRASSVRIAETFL
jgi:NTE family protein